jgi:GxxExxY protein
VAVRRPLVINPCRRNLLRRTSLTAKRAKARKVRKEVLCVLGAYFANFAVKKLLLTSTSINNHKSYTIRKSTLASNGKIRPHPSNYWCSHQDSSPTWPGFAGICVRSMLSLRVAKRRLVCGTTEASPVDLRKRKTGLRFRGRLVVQNRIVVELKCKDALHPVDEAQLLSHLRLLNVPIGLLINFHVVLLRDGIRGMVNDYREDDVLEEELLTAKFAK